MSGLLPIGYFFKHKSSTSGKVLENNSPTGKVNKLHYLIIGGIPFFYFNILGHYYPIFLSRYVIFAFVLSLFLWSLFWYILYIIEFYIILVHALDPNYMKLSPKYPSFIQKWYEDLVFISTIRSEAWVVRTKLRFLFIYTIMLISYIIFYLVLFYFLFN